jgi:transglutaminase-like putative cysteine protease
MHPHPGVEGTIMDKPIRQKERDGVSFAIRHLTEYRYSAPASEAYLEVRLTPPRLPYQKVYEHRLAFRPEAETSDYKDFFGNCVTFFAMPLRHESLRVDHFARVEILPRPRDPNVMNLSLAEVRQLVHSQLADVFDYLQACETIPAGGESARWAKRFLRDSLPFGEALERLNSAIHQHFEYVPGSTDVATPVPKVWRQRKGVCQDFAQVMLSILRSGGLPCRYVCGYIEGHAEGADGAQLVGTMATHAWVEVRAPGGNWLGLDPTNRCWCGTQHISVSFGRDYHDASPLRGTFKTVGSQSLSVKVRVKRL